MKREMKETLAIWLIILSIILVSWGVTCFIIWLATLCFGLSYSLKIATGIWLVMLLIGGLFKGNAKN